MNWPVPAPPGIVVIRDGIAPVVEWIEDAPHSGPPSVVLKPVNPGYDSYGAAPGSPWWDPGGRRRRARLGLGRRAGVVERHRATVELGLPVDAGGCVLYLDVQIEYVDAEGRRGRVNVEVISRHYDVRKLGEKTAAGFRMHADGALAARRLARFRTGGMGP